MFLYKKCIRILYQFFRPFQSTWEHVPPTLPEHLRTCPTYLSSAPENMSCLPFQSTWEHILPTLPEHLRTCPFCFRRVLAVRALVFYLMFCRPLFVLFSFFFCPLYCLSFFDVRLLIASLVSSNICNMYMYLWNNIFK